MRFIISWTDDHDHDRDTRRTADSVEEALEGVHDFLEGEKVYDEEKADADTRPEAERSVEDFLTPAYQVFVDRVTDAGDLAAYLAGMKIGKSETLTCENGTFEIFRER